jgi:hypothetical protein
MNAAIDEVQVDWDGCIESALAAKS